MQRWLLKTEPDCYSWEHLARDRRTVWDGISNALALKYIRSMKKGDQALIYHTGDEKSVIGTATIASDPYPDPNADSEKLAVVDLKIGKRLAAPVSLSDIKNDPAFEGWQLLKIGRLGVVPVPDPMWTRVEELSKNIKTDQKKPNRSR